MKLVIKLCSNHAPTRFQYNMTGWRLKDCTHLHIENNSNGLKLDVTKGVIMSIMRKINVSHCRCKKYIFKFNIMWNHG